MAVFVVIETEWKKYAIHYLARRICTIVSETHTRYKRIDELKIAAKLRHLSNTVIEAGI